MDIKPSFHLIRLWMGAMFTGSSGLAACADPMLIFTVPPSIANGDFFIATDLFVSVFSNGDGFITANAFRSVLTDANPFVLTHVFRSIDANADGFAFTNLFAAIAFDGHSFIAVDGFDMLR